MAAFVVFLVLSAVVSTTFAETEMLQDICVADLNSGLKLNGYPCKEKAVVEDFSFNGIAKPGTINSSMGIVVSGANVQKIPGLNMQGISMARIDYKPGGLNPPHTHPRASEMIFVLNGEVEVGFITTAGVLISKTVKQGEVFVFPQALVHFQKNNDDKPASVLAAFNSQFPGSQPIHTTLFAANPPLPNDVLSKAFQLGNKEIEQITSKLAPKKT